MKRNTGYLSWPLLLAAGTCCLGEDVTVRVVNADNEHPLRKESVSVSMFYAKGEPAPPSSASIMKLKTDRNGEAQFRLPEPMPEHISIKVKLNSGHWHFQDWAMIPTRELEQTGVIEEPESEATISPTAAKPGVALFLARPASTMASSVFSPVWRALTWPFHWL